MIKGGTQNYSDNQLVKTSLIVEMFHNLEKEDKKSKIDFVTTKNKKTVMERLVEK